MSSPYEIGSSVGILLVFCFLIYAFIIRKQDTELNWAIFYALLYTILILPIVNMICIYYGLWDFEKSISNVIKLPLDIYFLWITLWSIIPVYFFKGKYLLLLSIVLLWIDILIMPVLDKQGILVLNDNWLWGEIILIVTVFIPAYFWAYCSYYKRFTGVRAIFQIVVMIAAFIIGIPFVMKCYGIIESIQLHFAPYLFQFLLILTFPALVAVYDLVTKGKGTPFPYDPTKDLVRSGVYAYIKNPIQWSFTLMFIPLSLYYGSYFFLLGSLVSIFYVYGISNFQEYSDMKTRFGKEWLDYKSQVPSWRFLWKPTNIPKAEIFFDDDCNQCSQIKRWFISSKSINLHIKSKAEYPKDQILQVTYIDYKGREYKGVCAIAHAMEHINLAYASLAWFMRMPIINQVLQIIIDSMDVGNTQEKCELS